MEISTITNEYYNEYFLECIAKYGKFATRGGVILACTQAPYIQHKYGKEGYVCHAIDEFENEFEIFFNIKNTDCEDESESCDWNCYTVRKL